MDTRTDRPSRVPPSQRPLAPTRGAEGTPQATPTQNPVALLRLLQITSSNFPIGVFAYSQGLEGAVERGWVKDAHSLNAWVQGLLDANLARVDVPLLARAYLAWQQGDVARAGHWSRVAHAFREGRELIEEDRHLGRALARALHGLGVAHAEAFVGAPHASYSCLYALAAASWGITLPDAASAFVFGWAENQVLVASRVLPLGQTAAQQVLSELLPAIPRAVSLGLALPDCEIGGLAPAFALTSAWHEEQYSRLFRS